MAGTFPTLKSGRLAYYGTEIAKSLPTKVIEFLPGNEKRWRSGQGLADMTLQYLDCSPYDRSIIEKFVDSQKGGADSTWSIAIEDPPGVTTTYNNMMFVEDSIQYTNTRDERSSFSAKIRQVAANTSSPTIASLPATLYFPQFSNGVMAQFPFVSERGFETVKNDMESGARWAYSLRGGGLSGYPTGKLMRWSLQFASLTDTDRDVLMDFHNSVGGMLQPFVFLDPTGNLVQYSDDFSNAAWTRTSVTVGSSVADPFGGTLATSLTASSGDSYLTTPVLASGLASGMIVTGSVWAYSASASSLEISVRDNAGTVFASVTGTLPAGRWVRLVVPATISSSNPVLFRIGGASTFSTTIWLFGAKVSPLPGPGGYVSSPTNYGYHASCRFGNERFAYRKVGPNQNSTSVEIEEFWP